MRISVVEIRFRTYGECSREMQISVVEIRFRTYGECSREMQISVVEIHISHLRRVLPQNRILTIRMLFHGNVPRSDGEGKK